jgi:hypothetical protein
MQDKRFKPRREESTNLLANICSRRDCVPRLQSPQGVRRKDLAGNPSGGLIARGSLPHLCSHQDLTPTGITPLMLTNPNPLKVLRCLDPNTPPVKNSKNLNN